MSNGVGWAWQRETASIEAGRVWPGGVAIREARKQIGLALAAGLVLWAGPACAQPSFRHLSGTVVDPQHEPLKGAVVEVENLGDKSVQSFLTDQAGHYDFKRLDGNADYSFWAQYRGHKSRTRSLSKFSSKMTPVVTLTIKLE